VTVGSDHTDRKAEAIGVSLSKQMCAKVICADAWLYGEVKHHWDKLVLRSWADGELYQEGPVTAMRSPEELTKLYGGLVPGAAMFCGTLAAKGRHPPGAQVRHRTRGPRAQAQAQARVRDRGASRRRLKIGVRARFFFFRALTPIFGL
jgi:hypothetical protein